MDRARSQERRAPHRDEPGAYGWKVRHAADPRPARPVRPAGHALRPGRWSWSSARRWSRQILKAGHEIAHHSWSHAWIVNLTLEQEREEMDKGIDIITRMTGRKPGRLPLPGGGVQPHTLRMLARVRVRLLLELLRRRLAVSPPHRRHAHRHRRVPIRVGAGRRAVLPVLDHAARARPCRRRPAVFEAWRREFDVLYREDRYFCLAMHPADHRSPVAHHAAGRADPVHPRPSRGSGPARCDQVADALRPALRAEATRAEVLAVRSSTVRRR